MKKILCFFLRHKWHRVIRKKYGEHRTYTFDFFKCLRCPEWKIDAK